MNGFPEGSHVLVIYGAKAPCLMRHDTALKIFGMKGSQSFLSASPGRAPLLYPFPVVVPPALGMRRREAEVANMTTQKQLETLKRMAYVIGAEFNWEDVQQMGFLGVDRLFEVLSAALDAYTHFNPEAAAEKRRAALAAKAPIASKGESASSSAPAPAAQEVV